MDDRNALIAVFKAIAAVYEHSAGKRLVISVETPEGIVKIGSDGSHIKNNSSEDSA